MLSKLLKPLVPYLPENNRLERIWKLAIVDFNSRYYEHSLGLLWALIKPTIECFLFYFVFSTLLPVDFEYFGLYIFGGLIIWSFFIEGTNKGLLILQQKKYLIESIRFNKLDLFYSTTFSAFVAFLFNLFVLLVISLFFGINIFHWSLLLLPIWILNLMILILAIGLILATIKIYLNDIQNLWDMVMLVGFWATPIVYDFHLLEEKAPILIICNPLTGIVINLRETIIYHNPPNIYLIFIDFVIALILLGIGLFIFSKFSHKAAEKL